ncbi:predicted protein [Nematostella vectensis]|uniref:Exosome complex component MTR3 n=1 Tax=Nematostella vectensis TaxID=45351 RepID=A7RQ94_NEMVE|nr:predicted protein [Nematostella vectensis]|eukprot:XP_001638317.1 predicted protein [Nematostella vectensis]
MPFDSKRINGPEVTQPVVYKSKSNNNEPLIRKDGCRQDGRRPDELRPMFLRAGVVSQAKGSAYIEMKNTKVICAIYGPREAPRRQEFSMKGRLTCEFKFAPFSCIYRRKHIQDAEEKENSYLVVQALEPAVCLEKFPKAQVDIYITVLENDGSALSAGIICASVALAMAGIEMLDLVSACTMVQSDNHILMDPCEKEIHSSSASGHTMVAILPSLNVVSGLVQEGELTQDAATKALSSCIEGCARILPIMQQALVKNIKTQFTATKPS